MARSWFAALLCSLSQRPQRKRRRPRVQPELEHLESRITPQATRTWVSGVGDDANPCSRTAPGKTFAGAISKTALNGEIDALDSGGFGALTITKAITIDGGTNLASVLVTGTNAIVIQAPDTDVVILRHLKFQGLRGSGVNAIRITSAAEVHIEDCDIQGFGSVGIDYESTTNGGKLFVSNTDILNCAGGGLLMKPNGHPGTATLDHVFSLDNQFGFRAEDNATVAVRNSVASGNTANGFQTITTASVAKMNLENDLSSNNHMNGVTSEGINSQVTISNLTASGNWGEGIATVSGGSLFSFGNNRLADNARGPTTLGTGSGSFGGSATRTWVSGVGDDANPASRTAPAKTWAGAIAKTATGGEIDALDPGGFGAVTIVGPVTIDGSGTFASILAAGTNAIVVQAGASDVVILRGLSLNGDIHTGLNGIKIISAGNVIIEDSAILNFQVGIDFEPTNPGAQLFVENTVVRDNSTAGIVVKPNGVHAMAMIDGVLARGNGVGFDIENNADATISHSTADGNTNNGFQVEATTVNSVMTLESDTSSNNGGNGVFAQGPTGGSSSISATVHLSNVNVTGNSGMGLLAAASSPTDSFISVLTRNQITNNLGGDGAANRNLFAEHFVLALFLDDLGRPGSTAEVQNWAQLLNGPNGSQANVATAIARSPEALDHLVKSWYLTYLGRAAMNGEEQGWVTRLAQGQTAESVLSAILGDSGHDFFNHAQTLVSSGTPQERYVKALYLLALNRTASANEVAGWVNALPQLGLVGVALQLLQSSEYRSDVVTGYYNLLLHRQAGVYGDPGGLAGWVFQSHQDLNTIRIGFEGSAEFFING
jgi:hypothetical protein